MASRVYTSIIDIRIARRRDPLRRVDRKPDSSAGKSYNSFIYLHYVRGESKA